MFLQKLASSTCPGLARAARSVAQSGNGTLQQHARGLLRYDSGQGLSHTPWMLRSCMPVSTSTDSEELIVTAAAAQRLAQLNAEPSSDGSGEMMLRVSVDGGGCSGFQYAFTFETEVQEGDRTFEKDGSKVVVDDISLSFVKGATVDFTTELIRSSFQITENPNVESGCGCGASFAPK